MGAAVALRLPQAAPEHNRWHPEISRPAPAPGRTGRIEGRVWHRDVSLLSEEGGPATPRSGVAGPDRGTPPGWPPRLH